VVINNVVPYVVIAVMVFVSITVGKRSRAAAQRRYGQAALPPEAVPAEATDGAAGQG
jgi:large-conductance mechanosensitive channel